MTATAKPSPAKTRKRAARVRAGKIEHAKLAGGGRTNGTLALEEARKAGLLDGPRTGVVSFRASQALIDAAQAHAGTDSPTEFGTLALALLAQSDPFADFLRETRGVLGADHTLDC